MLFQMLPVFRAVVAFVGIDGRAVGYTFQQRRQVVALMGIGGGDVQFLDIAFLIGTGMLFVTEFVEAVFLCPAGIAVFARCGLAADLSFVIDFYGLTLFAAGGLDNGGVNDGGGCFLYLRPLQNSPKSPKFLPRHLGDFGEFCKGLRLSENKIQGFQTTF